MKKYEEYLKAKAELEAARKWNDLPSGEKYGNSTFKIYASHSKAPRLMRAGKQSHAGQNYWESPVALNSAILSVIVHNEKEIIKQALDLMEEIANTKLKECQDFVDELQSKINEAKGSVSETNAQQTVIRE